MTVCDEAENAQYTCLPTVYINNTSRFDLYYNCGDHSLSQSVGRGLDKSHPEKGTPNLLQMALKGVGKQTTSESTDSHSTGEQGGTKDNQASSSKPGVLTAHSSAPGSSGGAASSSSQDPNEPRQGVSLLSLVINDDKFADDPHQIIPSLSLPSKAGYGRV